MTTGLPEDDPEQLAVLDCVQRLSRDGHASAGAVADDLCFPLPEVRRILDQLTPARVAVGPGNAADGTPTVRLV